jgi:hypothetical protein
VTLGERVPGAEGDETALGNKRRDRDVVGVDRQPQERGIGRLVTKARCRVAPPKRAEFDAPAGFAFGEMLDNGGIQGAPDGCERPDPQRAKLFRGGVRDRGHALVPFPQQPAGDCQELGAGPGELDLAAIAGKQLRSQPGLQAVDLLAEGGLGQMQPLGGPREVQLLGHRYEIPQIPQVGVHNRW